MRLEEIVCECCGGREFAKRGEKLECEYCGSIYTVDDNQTVVDKTLTDAKIVECYLEASRCVEANDRAGEFKALTKAMEMAPNNALTLVKLGRCYRNLGMQDKAIQAYQRAIAIDPQVGSAYTNMGTIYILNKQYREAVEQYEKGLPLIDKGESDYWVAYANYAVAVAQLGNKPRAEQMIREAERNGYQNADPCRVMAGLKTSTSNQVNMNQTLMDAKITQYYAQATKCAQANDRAGEFQALSKALELDPNNAITLVKLGRCYRNLGMQDKAIQAYQNAIAIDPSQGTAYTNMGTIYILNKQYREAAEQYEKGLRFIHTNDSDYWVGYANYAIAVAQLGDKARAEKMIKEAEQHGYKNGQSCREMAGIKKQGCYVATAVYGSYDCPQVWTLRRYRDDILGQNRYGRAFIRMYYAISPTLVKWFGKANWFQKLFRGVLDRMVAKLHTKGIESTPYEDRHW